jgi:hypothetical protein
MEPSTNTKVVLRQLKTRDLDFPYDYAEVEVGSIFMNRDNTYTFVLSNRVLVFNVYTCNLRIEGHSYFVLDNDYTLIQKHTDAYNDCYKALAALMNKHFINVIEETFSPMKDD